MPHVHALNLELTETVSLAALFENRVEVVAVVESPHDIRMSNVVGHILPPNASSLGKVITAFQPPVQREGLLRSFKIYRFTDQTITDHKDLSREYENIRLQKFAIDREECAPVGFVSPYRSSAQVVRFRRRLACRCRKPDFAILSRKNQSSLRFAQPPTSWPSISKAPKICPLPSFKHL